MDSPCFSTSDHGHHTFNPRDGNAVKYVAYNEDGKYVEYDTFHMENQKRVELKNLEP